MTYYKKRNGEFHGTARISGQQIQESADRITLFVWHLLLYLLRCQLLCWPQKVEAMFRACCRSRALRTGDSV